MDFVISQDVWMCLGTDELLLICVVLMMGQLDYFCDILYFCFHSQELCRDDMIALVLIYMSLSCL